MSILPVDYVIQNLYTYCKRPVYKRNQKVYNAECCICNEGASAGRKRRLFYFPDKRYFYCFNCSQSWKEVQWLQQVTNKSYTEILADTKNYATEFKPETVVECISETIADVRQLPDNCVDLEDQNQINFYSTKKREYKKIINAIEYCTQRQLFTSVNRCSKFYLSLDDKLHTNRLVIPFFDQHNTLACYQSRALTSTQFPKYLTKEGEKCLFGEDRIKEEIPYIFIFEGPIDSMFVQNGVAMAGTDLTEKQQHFLDNCIGYEKIFIYDNDKNNNSLAKKIKNKLKAGHKVFIWPEKFSKFKDVNEVCCKLKLNEFNWKFIVSNSFSETEGIVKYTLTQNLSG